MPNPRVLAFDVFGTVIDWRSGIIRDSKAHLATIGRSDIDAAAFADAWPSRYQPAMAAVRDGERPFVILDVLHRETLEAVLTDRDVDVRAIEATLLEDWTRAWHRLDPWPDAVEGLTRLKARFPIVTLSNGNIALMLAMARRGRLPWDAILGAEVARAYKPSQRPTPRPLRYSTSRRKSFAWLPRIIVTLPLRDVAGCLPPMSIARWNGAGRRRQTGISVRNGNGRRAG